MDVFHVNRNVKITERERKREKEHVQQIFQNGTCSFDFDIDTLLSFYGKNQSSNYLWYSTLYII